MAEAVIGATIQVVLQTVISLAAERIGLLLGFHEELGSLKDSATMLQAFLADAEARQEQKQKQAVKLWLKRLEGVAFDADHLLDEFNYEILRRKVKSRNQQVEERQVCTFFFSFSYANIAFRSRMASKIRDIKIKLENITQDASKFGLIIRHQLEDLLPATAGATTSRLTDSVVVPNAIRRDEDESKIVEMLLSPSPKAVSVIPITGMGGRGKTTLAKSIYNNSRIDNHFDKKIWVCVAEKIEIMKLFKFIFVSLTKEKVGEQDREAIIQTIREKVGEKKYFLVLDDVWDDEPDLWNDFFNTLGGLNASNGSKCLVTTRLEEVANVVCTQSRDPIENIHELGKLSDDECWTILKQKVIGDKQVPEELEKIKKQILQRCDGLPLAVHLIGGLLLRHSKENWQSFVENNPFHEDPNYIDKIIKLSFDHLSPASVKKCFAYCSIFPQDTILEKDLLIELWMAEGFVQPDPRRKRSMEAIGDEHFRILLQSSLLEIRYQDGKIYGYKMHGLVYNIAKSVLNPESENEYRYLALSSSEGTAENIIKSTSLRTLCLESGIASDMLSKFKYLHVLKLSGADVTGLPTSISKLIHLRRLDVSGSQIKTFPESLCKLYNLQTLRMDDDILKSKQGGFPKEMGNLINLRHLHYYDSDAEFQMPLEIGRLTCLQTLKFFNIGKKKGCGIEELGTLKDLKGELVIRNLKLVKGKGGAKQAKLFEKPNLCRLKFEWETEDRDCSVHDYEEVLEGLQPYPNLKEFEICNFMGKKFPQWFMGLTTLVKLELKNCRRFSELSALGQLPRLESLTLIKMGEIKWKEHPSSVITIDDKIEKLRKLFPALKYICMEHKENLVEWKGTEEVMSAADEAPVMLFDMLKELTIDNCHVSLIEKILSNITTTLEIRLDGDNKESNRNEHIRRLCFEPPPRGGGRSRLRLEGCGNLSSEMMECLCGFRTLEHLNVRHCPNLTSLRSFNTGLRILVLLHCENLHLSELGKFQDLVMLDIGPFSDDSSIEKIDWSGLKSLSKLKSLILRGSLQLESLPDQLQYLTILDDLRLYDFGIEALPDWLGKLGSLQQLNLVNCKRLRCFPSVDVMKSLTKLICIRASRSPLLKERWKNNELPEISHIYCEIY